MTHLALHAPFDPTAWWQLWSCHLTHWDGSHLMLNVMATLPVLLLVRRPIAVAWLWRTPIALPLMSAALLASGFRGEYRGASGLVVSLWAFGAVALVRDRPRHALLLIVPLIGKLIAEANGVWPAASGNFITVATVHYAGAAAGALAAITMSMTQLMPLAGKEIPR